jgi:medium-chain acyl-[acyl-carrier-protein] hydrolase
MSAFFNLIQAAASDHAEELGLGLNSIQQLGIFWVLSWVRVEVEAYPGYRMPVTAATWPHSRHRIFSLRDFIFSGPGGQIFARARSAWLLVDAEHKRVAHLERLPRPVPYVEDRQAMEALPQKMAPLDGGETVLRRTIGYSDLDLNQHANNARYVQLLMDSYPLEFHRQHDAAALTISFSAESRAGDVLEIRRQGDRVAGMKGEETVFRADVEWRPRP